MKSLFSSMHPVLHSCQPPVQNIRNLFGPRWKWEVELWTVSLICQTFRQPLSVSSPCHSPIAKEHAAILQCYILKATPAEGFQNKLHKLEPPTPSWAGIHSRTKRKALLWSPWCNCQPGQPKLGPTTQPEPRQEGIQLISVSCWANFGFQ